MPATLFLIPSPLTEKIIIDDIPQSAANIIKEIDYFIVESFRRGSTFIKLFKGSGTFEMRELNEHTDNIEIENLLCPILQGRNGGLLSDAGSPCIADPGTELVMSAHRNNLLVKPLPGLSSIFLALISSGLSGQKFAFHGYLPREKNLRIKALKDLEEKSRKNRETQIIMETPYRSEALVQDLLQTLSDNCHASVAVNLREEDERIISGDIRSLKKMSLKVNKSRVVVVIGGVF